MAGFMPGLLPTNHSQEKEFAKAYEDVLERYKETPFWGFCSLKAPREKGRMRFHRLQNVQIALDFLKQRQVKLVNIRNDDITDGNPKLTLGLIWTIILHFQISEIYVSGESGDLTAKEKLLLWTQQATEGYPGLRCSNFSSSWSNGRMFNALLHRYRPDLIDMEVVARQSNRENLEQAFEIAESLGVTRLLDAEDVDVPSPDEKSVITYVSSIYDAFPKIPEGGEGITPHEVDQRWAEYQSRFSSLLQWTRQHTALMANKSFPQNPVELKALYNEYIHFKETEIPAKEMEKGHIEHLYKLLEVWLEFGRFKLPQGLHPNDLEEEWGKLILEMLEREKALRPAVERLELLLQMANKFQNMAVDCEEKLTLARNTLQADMSHLENGEPARCEQELGAYLQDCEALVRQLQVDLQVLRDEKYYQVEQLAFRVTRLQEELVSLRLQCSSVYRKGHFSSGGLLGEQPTQKISAGGLATLGAQTVLGEVGAVASLLRRPMSRSDLVAMSSSEDEGSLRFIYELLGWVEETQELLERAEWGSDLPSVEQHLQEHHTIHTAVEELLHSLKEARSYEVPVSPNFRSSYSETLAKLENQYCKLLEHSSWRLRCLESLRAFVSQCTEELIWLNEKEEEELAFDWSESNTNMAAKREQFAETREELDEKQEVMRSLQETADQLCLVNHPAKQTVEAYSAALQTQWQWVRQLCVCVEQHLKDNTAYFQFMSDARECETYLRQLQDTIKRQYTCDRNSRLGKLEDLLQDSMEEKEQLIEYRSSVASLVGRAKTIVQLRPRSVDCIVGTTTPIRAICDYKQIEITVNKGEECVLEDNSQRTKWKIISPTGNEAMVPSVCFTVPPPNQEAIDIASRYDQQYQNVMSLWHQLHMNMKSVVSWHYLQKDISNISSWTLDKVSTFAFKTQLYIESMCTKDESMSRSYLSELQSIKSHLQEAEQRLLRGMNASPPSGLSGDGADTAVHIAEQEKLQQDLKGLQSNIGDVSRRCVNFFEEKPTSSSVPVLRSELNLAVEKIEKLDSLSSVYLHKLKTVDVLMRSLQIAESHLKRYEGRLSEEDIVPADTTAIQALREQLKVSHIEHKLCSYQLHPDRSPELDRYQEKAQQLIERWNGVRRQMETRQADLEMLGSVLQQYREGHSALIHWIEETTEKQENTQPEQTDSKALSEQLAQQTALVAEIEQNQVKLDECQKHSKHYCTAVKDYELQLMTFRAFVESTQKSPVKRRRMHSSSDAITQEFMDLRTRYTALVTLTTQHVKYISDALRRLEEEEVWFCCPSKRAQVTSQLDELTATYSQLCDSSAVQLQQLEEQLAKEEKRKTIAGVIDLGTMETFPVFQAAHRGLLDLDTCHVLLEAQEFISASQPTKEQDEPKPQLVRLLEGQIVSGGIVDPQRGKKVSVTLAANLGLVEEDHKEELLALEKSCRGKSSDPLVSKTKFELQLQMDGVVDPKTKEPLPLQEAIEKDIIGHEEAEQILLQQVAEGGILHHGSGVRLTVTNAVQKGLIDQSFVPKLEDFEMSCFIYDTASKSRLTLTEAVSQGIIEEDTAEKAMEAPKLRTGVLDPHSAHVVPYTELINKGKIDIETGQRFLEVRPFRGFPHKESGDMMTVPEAVKSGQVDPIPALRVLQSQADSGGIINITDGKRLSIPEAVEKGLIEKDVAKVIVTNQLVKGGLINPVSGQKVSGLKEAVQEGLITEEMAADLWDNFGPVDEPIYGEETPKTLSLSQDGKEHYLMSQIGSNQGSDEHDAHLSESEKTPYMIKEHFEGILEIDKPDHIQLIQHHSPSEEAMDEQGHEVGKETLSMDLHKDIPVSSETLTRFPLSEEEKTIKDFGPTRHKDRKLQHESSEIQTPQVSLTESEDGKQHDPTHTPAFTSLPNNQMQMQSELTATQKLEESGYRLEDASDITPKLNYPQPQALSDFTEKSKGQFPNTAEQQSLFEANPICETKDETDGTALSTSEGGEKMPGKKNVKRKNKKQARMGTERDERLEVIPVNTDIASPVEHTKMENGKELSDIVEKSAKIHVKVEKEAKEKLEFSEKVYSSVAEDVEDAALKDFLDVQHKDVRVDLEAAKLDIVTQTESTEIADGKERKVKVNMENLTPENLSLTTHVKGTDHKTSKEVDDQAIRSALPQDSSIVTPIKETERKIAKEGFSIDKSIEGDVTSKSKVVLKGFKPPAIGIASPGDFSESTPEKGTEHKVLNEVVTVDNKSSEAVEKGKSKAVLEAPQPPNVGIASPQDLSVATPVKETENKSTKVVNIDKSVEGDVKGKSKVVLKGLKPPVVGIALPQDLSEATLVKDMNRKTSKDVVGTGDKAIEGVEKGKSKGILKALQPPDVGIASSQDLSVATPVKDTKHKTAKADVKGRSKVALEVLQPADIGIASPKDLSVAKPVKGTEHKTAKADVKGEGNIVLDVLPGIATPVKGAKHKTAEDVVSTADKSIESDVKGKSRVVLEVQRTPGTIRQECLEHDQKVVALLSMVRHIEVRLKQHQQQSVGRSLIALDDIIRQTEVSASKTVALELSDLEPQVNQEVEASRQLLNSNLEDVPPQLLKALEKDERSLSRAFDAANELSRSVVQGMKSQYGAQKVSKNYQLISYQSVKSSTLHSKVTICNLVLSKLGKLIFFLFLFFCCQELEEYLTAHSTDVSTVAFDIQVFISERAQDLEPEQSRQLLRQLQQLQRAFHQASGRAHARAEALAVQRAREEEREQHEKQRELEKREREKERQTALKREEVQKDLKAKGDGVAEAIRSVEEFLAERGDDLSPEERANLQGALKRMKEQYSTVTETAQSSLTQLDTAISTTVQQNTQRVTTSYSLQFISLPSPKMPDSSVPPEEKQRLRARLDQLQSQHQERLQSCQDRQRRTEALKDELAKFLQEHGTLGTWLEQSELGLSSMAQGQADAQDLRHRLEEHKKLAEDLICHKADLRFVSISGQKVLDSVQGTLDRIGGTDPALEDTRQLVSDKLQDATQRYNSLQSKVGNHDVDLLHVFCIMRYLHLNNLTLFSACYIALESRFGTLSENVSQRAEQLQTAVAQSVSVQEGLKALLAWLDGLVLTSGPVQPTAQAVQEALTQNQKLRQELLSRQGSVEATQDSVSKLLKSADASTVSGLQGALQDLAQRYTAAQTKQAENETELRGLLPKLESFERLSMDLHSFTQSRERALSVGGQPECSMEDYRQLAQEASQLKSFVELGTDLSQSGVLANAHSLLDSTKEVSEEFTRLEATGCEQQLVEFRSLSGSLLRWLQTVQDQLPAKEPNQNTEGLQRRVQQLKVGLQYNLTEIQVAVAEVNSRYEQLGKNLQDRQGKQQASLELRQKARQDTETLLQWLGPREQSLTQGQAGSPSRPEVVRAQAQENKALLSELAERSGKVEDLKKTLKQLITENQDSPEAETWKQQLTDIDTRWEKANTTAAQRQTELETCADRLGSFASAANQLGPWLREKELMMSVLGPLSIDPNMLNTQKQQVQFMLREFETRRPQFDQLTQAAEGILSPAGEQGSGDKDLAEVHQELAAITKQWDDLTSRLSGRSGKIDQAQGTSERFQTLLRELSMSIADLGERLDAQASLSVQPEALRRRLQETGEIRAELEQRKGQLAQAEQLCTELSTIVAEPYLREELQKRLESVSSPLNSLEERAADGLSQLQSALSSTQQFQQMFEELRSWLDQKAGERIGGANDPLPCWPEALQTLLSQQEELLRGVAQQRGSYDLIQAEGTSLLASLPAGDERSALQSRLSSLRQDWEGLNQRLNERQARIKETLSRAEQYRQHRDELAPWVTDCEQREAEIQPSLDPAALEEALQKARQLGLDLDRRRPLLENLNSAADQLLEQSRTGEEEVRDEKAQLNRRVDSLSERLHGRTAQLEELGSRLKEFEEGRQAVERRLEAAKHQLEVQEALGPQACSNKSLERLRSQQELLNSLQPQVVYLRDLAQGLVQDMPQAGGDNGDGGQQLVNQACDTEREFGEVTEKIEQCCTSLESRLQGVGEVQSRVRDVFSRLADLDDELDSLSPVGRDVDSLASQAEAVKSFLGRLATLRTELEGHGGECTTMLRREGSSPDLLALRRETEALNRQAGKLAERGQGRLALIEAAEERVREFYARLTELQGLLDQGEDGVNAQGVVGSEVEVIKQQLQEFKAVEREQVDSIQPKVQHVNAVGQGLIQSAAKHTDTQALEHDLETTNLRWNSLNKRVAERIAQLQEALLHCGKFQDALEPLLSWLSDTEELIANQKPPSAEYRVVKAQIQEQKLLQRLLDDRRATVEMIRVEGERIASTAETQDRDKIQKQLQSLGERWTDLLEKASSRQKQLEELQVLALQFHETVEPLGEWLSATERRLSSAEPMGTQTSKITQQISRHKSLNEEIVSRKKTVDQAIKNGQALLKQTTGEEVLLIQEKLDGIKSRYAEMTAGSSKALRTLEQALQLSTRFASAHEDINQWLDSVEAELNNMEPDTTPAYQDRQKELKCVSAEKRLVLDTINEVGSALLDLVPWRAREGLDRLVADANQRYRQADETITQRVQLVQAAIQRSQQYEEAVDAELAWVGETERKLASLGPLSLEPDVTVAQLQVQRAFNIDIIRHKDTVDQLLNTREDILESCSEQQREALKVKTDSLSARYEAVSQNHAERFSALEQAQVLVARFWETYEELEPWLGETETLISQLPPPAIDTEALRQQQDQMRLLRESIAEHKPHIDKILKIGPQLAELSAQEGSTVRQRYSEAERRYLAIKEEVKNRAASLDEAFSQSAQFHDKMDPLLETLEGAVQRLRQPPPVAAEVEKIREQLAEHRAAGLELDKLLPSFSALCSRGEELITRAPHDDPAAQGKRPLFFSEKIRQRAEEREGKLQDVLDLAGKFWADMAALLSTLRDSQDIVKELEDPGVDPSLIKQQIEAAEAIKAETDGLREELEIVRTLGADLIFACGETEKPEVKKTIDEMNAAWEGLNRTWRERMEKLEEAMTASVQYQDALQGMFDYLDNAVIKLCEMQTIGTDLSTVKQQIEELKQYKVEVYQQQIDMEKLCHQGELLLKKVTDQTDKDMIQEPLTELRHLWDNLGEKITLRQHKLEGALLALGQFQHALSELQSWLSHTHATLDTQRPVSSDPKAIEIELAKHHVLRNDVLSHRATVETVNSAGSELLDSSPGDEASHLRDQLDELNRSWDSLLLKTKERQKLLEAALQQAEGFHGELEEFLQWLRRTESQLSAAKPTGGLPETAREQLQQHMELQSQLSQRGEQYHRLLDQGESMLLARGGEEAGPGTTQTQQNLALLQNKWASLNTKMDDRRAKLEEVVSLATGFQSSLQDTINWLTQAEQTLNMAQPPSLILDTVLFQIDEHKVFVNEVNTHREQVLALEKAGSQLRFASLKQDVVLIKNLLLSVQARWDKLVQRSLDRGRHLDEARKRAKQFHEAWRKLTDWLEEAESRLDSELEISNEPDKIKVQLAKHKEFQKALGSKQPVYDTTVRSGRAMRDKATLPADTEKLDHLLGEVRDKWDTVCGKSVERQHKLEEALLFSGQFAEALQALVDWLYRVEPQLAEDQPVHGDLDLVSNLMDSHKAFQKELGKRTSSVQALKRSARELMDTGRDDTAWVKVQLQELSNRWDTVCTLSVSKQTRLQQALKQAEEFRTAVQMLLEWLSEAEQTLRFRGVLPEESETLQELLHTHRDFMQTVEEKRVDVNKAAGMGEGILAVCHPDCITTIKHWITIIRARFEEVLTWAKQHEQRLETALTELLNNAALLEELLSWLQWAETTLVQRDTEPLPQDIPQLKTLMSEHQMFMEEMTRKQPDVDKVTKTYKRKPAEPPSSLLPLFVTGGNPRLTQLCSRWQQVWLLALDRQRKLHDALDRLEELKEFANFDFDVWRKKYMRWMNHKKSRVMDFFRRIDKDQDGKITRQEFIDGILASKFPTSKLEMMAVADIFDRDGDGYIDYYEFVAALHPNKDAYRPTTDADKIEDEVTRQVAQCKCAKRFQVEQIGENKYRFFLGNQFGDSQQLRLVRILRSTVMVRVGGGWMALDEFLVKNDPCRVQHPGLKILRSDSSSSISSRIGWVFLSLSRLVYLSFS
uniref:Microtubule actin crosslinking factor 1 n=1 Tax=Astyanax mexicanus TaxID=7994 RepID=A0A8B9KP53_ASTMX